MTALVVIDMQCGMLEGENPPADVDGVVERINRVAAAVRCGGGLVIWVQHFGTEGSGFEAGTPGWEFLPGLERSDDDVVVGKKICDAFYETPLEMELQSRGVEEIIIAGWATDFCVDTTVRAAASRDYVITVLGDGHTVADRAHLDAAGVIAHHHAVWEGMLVAGRRGIEVRSAGEVVRMLGEV